MASLSLSTQSASMKRLEEANLNLALEEVGKKLIQKK